jgi:hypothetical protein
MPEPVRVPLAGAKGVHTYHRHFASDNYTLLFFCVDQVHIVSLLVPGMLALFKAAI